MAAGLSWWEACLLGLVQGLTEFLPVSSDGHLAVLQHFLSPMPAEEKLAVQVALHFGTLVAVLGYFRRELLEMAGSLIGRHAASHARAWIGLLAVGSVPVAIVGVTLRSEIEQTFDSPAVIGISFLFTGALLFLAGLVQGADRDERALGAGDALLVGCFQTLALLPGVSRSGTTIAGALFRRTRADVAAKFSFLLSIPAIVGAILVEAKAIVGLERSMLAPLAAGVGVAGVTGVLAIALLLRALRGGKLRYFAYYCWALGVVVLIVGARGA